jgi:protein SCO1/2
MKTQKVPRSFLLGLMLVCAVHAAGIGPGRGSVYQLESIWHDQNGREVKLADLAGKIRILAMGYTSCQYACPRIMADMRAIQRALPKDERRSVAFTFVSFDPRRDTPDHLREFQSKNDLGAWTFLTGSEDAVLELSVALRVKFQKISDADFAHSNAIFVLAADGAILHRQDTLGEAPDEAVRAVLKAAR